MKPFCYASDLLLPPAEAASLFSVVACDQYTAEPAYWETVASLTEHAVSAYHMVYPEVYLGKEEPQVRIDTINLAMQQALDTAFFEPHPHAMTLTTRTLQNGAVRRGLVCCIDLEDYDFSVGSTSLIRATEGTVLSRIPPRVKVRSHAPLELPHVMLLIDDAEKTVLEPLTEKGATVYDFDLMQQSGHSYGRLLSEQEQQEIATALQHLYTNAKSATDAPLLFAVGDGNHSLATAKTCYENLKKELPEDEAKQHPARYALVEIVNLHDTSLEFEAIHRAVFGVDAEALLQAFCTHCNAVVGAVDGAQQVTVVLGNTKTVYSMQHQTSKLTVGTLQQFLDDYLQTNGGEVDYIHGTDVVESLCEKPHTIGFLLPAMQKEELFPAVMTDGALPRKTFSMGEACDKRFYLEARKITK